MNNSKSLALHVLSVFVVLRYVIAASTIHPPRQQYAPDCATTRLYVPTKKMAFYLNNLVFMARNRRALRRERVFRDRRNHFDTLTEAELISRYRFDRAGIMELVRITEADLQHPTARNHALTPLQQVMVALRFYATGSMQIVVGDTIIVSQPTVSRAIRAVSVALARRINNFVHFPEGNELIRNQESFHEMAHFPGVVGLIDGTHIRIQAPSEHEDEYVNRKNFHSINVQVIVDSNCNIINAVVKWPGSTHDSRILRESAIGRELEARRKRGILLADSGYPCRPWILTPFLNPANAAQARYNR